MDARDDRDIFRLAPSADPAVLDMIAARLEFRGTDEGYVRVACCPGDMADEWRAYQARSAADGTFFAASSYYTYLIRRPD